MSDRSAPEPRGETADSSWHPEVELKLQASPEAMARLLGVPPLAFGLGEGAPARRLESVYFDTAKHALRKAGIAMRVRRDGERFVQTLKIDAPGEAHARLERHDPADGFTARADVLREAVGERLGGIGDDDLKPLFATRIDRRTLVLPANAAQGTGSIEIAVDQGEIEAGERKATVCEIELELIEGTPADLYAHALTLHRLQPMAVEVRTKSDRGYALAGGRPPPWHKARDIAFGEAPTLGEGIATVLAHCFDHWTGNQAAALDGRDIEGVHQMRVALRRLRAAFQFFGPWLPGPQRTWLEGEVKWLGKRLGRCRDLDVLLVETVAPVRRARKGDADLKALAKAVDDRRKAAYAKLAEAVGSERYTTLVLTMGQWIAARAWEGRDTAALEAPLVEQARPALDGAYRSVMEHGEGFDKLPAERRHELRLEIKKLRYAIQFVGAAYGGEKAVLKLLGRLQDGLGAANDAAVSEELLESCAKGVGGGRERRSLAKATGLIAGWWLAHHDVRESDLRAMWSEFAGMTPFWRDGRSHLSLVDGSR